MSQAVVRREREWYVEVLTTTFRVRLWIARQPGESEDVPKQIAMQVQLYLEGTPSAGAGVAPTADGLIEVSERINALQVFETWQTTISASALVYRDWP